MPAESVMQLIYLNYFSWILQSWNKTVPNKWSFFPLMRYRVLFSFAAVFLSKLYSNGKGLWLWSSYFKKLENTENYINEKLGAEIQNRGEAAAPEKTTSITTTAQRGTGRAPVRRAGLAAASPRGLQGAGAEAGWRHQQRDPSSWWSRARWGGGQWSERWPARTGTAAETGGDWRQWHSHEKTDAAGSRTSTPWIEPSWTSGSGCLGQLEPASRAVSPENTSGSKISWMHRPPKRDSRGSENTPELSPKY